MEKAVMNATDIFLSAMAKAAQPGPVDAPNMLLAVIEAQSNPFQALSDCDASNEIFEAIRSQFAFVDFVRATGKPPNDEDYNKLISLLRWIMREGADWDISADPRGIRLTTLFAAGHFTAMGADFWSAVPDGFRPNDGLLTALERVIAGMKMSYATLGLSTPIWESEAVEQFKKADSESDWIGIAKGLHLFEDAFFPDIAIAQAAKCLYRFSPQRLVQAVSGLWQTVPIMRVVLSLDSHAALRIASGSANPYVQFATTYRTVLPSANRDPLCDASKELLIRILENVSKDTPRWATWMRVFNLFPSQFPELQAPLGCILAEADDAALQAYVDAIDLNRSCEETRFAVADCLRTFRDKAEVKKRQALWNLAYRRWTSWNFGLNRADESLTKIARCELDYALVGYAVECLDDAQRQHMLALLIEDLQTVEYEWHPGITHCISKWNTVLSKMQPLYLARSIAGTEADWIDQEPTMRLPFDPEKDAYVILQFGRPQIA